MNLFTYWLLSIPSADVTAKFTSKHDAEETVRTTYSKVARPADVEIRQVVIEIYNRPTHL